MAYGLIYNLNFSSNLEGNRAHRISIYKDGHTSTITTSDNNIIGTDEPAVLIWDNTDDIYNSIMSARLEINLLSDDTKMVDIDDILDNTTPAKYMVEFYMENEFGTMVKYWFGYLSNATYTQKISSVAVPYKLIATDLLGTLKNIYTTDGTAMVIPKSSIIKYLQNILAFLPQSMEWRVIQDIELKPWKANITTNVFEEMHFLQCLFPYKDGLQLQSETADAYITNIMKMLNSRIFIASNQWWIINNSTHPNSPAIDRFDSSGNFTSTSFGSVLKTIPTNFTPVLNDMTIRYDTPIDSVEVIANRNEYTTDFDSVGQVSGEISNLSPYPSFESKVNGILFNNTYYSDDFSSIEADPQVKSGNYSIKTKNYINTGNPTQKILDTGFVGDDQWEATLNPTFFCSYFIQKAGTDTEDFHLYYSIAKQNSGGLKYYWNGNNWVSYTLDSSIAVLLYHASTSPTDTWNDVSVILGQGISTSNIETRYRIILWQPKLNGTTLNDRIVYFDDVLLNRYNVLDYNTPIHTISRISGSQRKNKKYTHEFTHQYPVAFATQFKTPTISFTDTIGFTQLNRIIAQQILNDNRKHIKRYNMSMYATDKNQFLYPYTKMQISLTGYTSDNSCIIDRIEYRAKSGIYNVDMHESDQSSNVTLDTDVIRGFAQT